MIMTWVVEIILVCVFIYGAYHGYVNGFFRLCIRPFKAVFGMILAFSLCRPVGSLLISPMLETSVKNYLEEYFKNNNVDKVPTIIKVVGVISGNEGVINSQYSISEIVSELALPFVSFISSVIAFVLLYFSLKLIFGVVLSVINTLFDAGIIGKINRWFGMLFAILFSILALWCIVGMVDFIFHNNLFSNIPIIKNYVPGPIYKIMKSLSPIELLLGF